MCLTHAIAQNVAAINERLFFAIAQPILKITADNKFQNLFFLRVEEQIINLHVCISDIAAHMLHLCFHFSFAFHSTLMSVVV